MPKPELVAHRGYAAKFPENTLPALEAAVAAGARHVEIDVQLSRDGVPMLFHDAELLRMTGRELVFFEQNADALARETCFYPSGAEGPAATIPRLRTFIEFLREHPDVTAYVEIKEESLDAFGIDTTVRQILADVQPAGQQVVLISFHLGALEMARALGCGLRLGWVLHRWDAPSRLAALRVKPEFLICNYTKIQPRIGALWPGPWAWMLYEVTQPQLALDLAGLGAHFVETMQIEPMISALRKAR
ncbi:MAG: glycerophosphodiester phosphodiesterase family protein [Gammaproteobacteria bacterium]|nr:glycerophosphodiester phosphodiesterase family protein [Gammaproteobacteria bacterium]